MPELRTDDIADLWGESGTNSARIFNEPRPEWRGDLRPWPSWLKRERFVGVAFPQDNLRSVLVRLAIAPRHEYNHDCVHTLRSRSAAAGR